MKAKRKQLLATLGLVALGLVVGVAGLLLAVLPQRSHAHDLDAQIAAAQTKLASLHNDRSRGPAIRAAQLFDLARAMPDDADVPGIVVNLARDAASAHVTIVSITPAAPVAQTDGASGIPLQLSVTGSWNGIATFLRTLRDGVRVRGKKLSVSGRLFTVDSVQLGAGGGAAPSGGGTTTTGAPSPELSANLNVNAFSYGLPPAPSAAGATTGTTTTTQAPGSAVAAGPGSAG